MLATLGNPEVTGYGQGSLAFLPEFLWDCPVLFHTTGYVTRQNGAPTCCVCPVLPMTQRGEAWTYDSTGRDSHGLNSFCKSINWSGWMNQTPGASLKTGQRDESNSCCKSLNWSEEESNSCCKSLNWSGEESNSCCKSIN